MQQQMIYHFQIQADFFKELKQTADKNASSLQHLLERTGSLESRTSVVERLQDAVEQRVELLDERRERTVDRYDSKIENLEEQAIRINANMSDLTRKLDDIQLETDTSHTMSSGYGTGEIGTSNAMFPFGPGVSGRVGTMNSTTAVAPHGSVLTPISTTSSLGPSITAITPQRIESLTTRLVELEHSLTAPSAAVWTRSSGYSCWRGRRTMGSFCGRWMSLQGSN